jgi:hypothetical protein
MRETLDRGIAERRTIEQALADLLAAYEKRPHAALARMIEHLEAELAARKSSAAKVPSGQDKSAA